MVDTEAHAIEMKKREWRLDAAQDSIRDLTAEVQVLRAA